MNSIKDRARILIFDGEMSNLDAAFGFVLCISYRWMDEPENKTHTISIRDFPSYKRTPRGRTNDLHVLEAFRPIWEQADIIITYNGKLFDEKYVNTRLMIHGRKPLPRRDHVDVLDTTRSTLRTRGKSLDKVAKMLKTKHQKSPVDGQIWVWAVAGDEASLRYIETHCKADVLVLEEVYLRFRERVYMHPRVTWVLDACRYCGGKVQSRGYTVTTARGRKRRVACTSCGGTETRAMTKKEQDQAFGEAA